MVWSAPLPLLCPAAPLQPLRLQAAPTYCRLPHAGAPRAGMHPWAPLAAAGGAQPPYSRGEAERSGNQPHLSGDV